MSSTVRPGRPVPSLAAYAPRSLGGARRLRGPRLPWRGDHHAADLPQAAVPEPRDAAARQPRNEDRDDGRWPRARRPPAHDWPTEPDGVAPCRRACIRLTGVRLLQGVHGEVRQRDRVEVLHRPLRLPHRGGRDRQQHLLRPRRCVPTSSSTDGGRRPPLTMAGRVRPRTCATARPLAVAPDRGSDPDTGPLPRWARALRLQDNRRVGPNLLPAAPSRFVAGWQRFPRTARWPTSCGRTLSRTARTLRCRSGTSPAPSGRSPASRALTMAVAALVPTRVRGAGFSFGRRVVERFCQVNSVTHILRAHQLCQEGYQVRPRPTCGGSAATPGRLDSGVCACSPPPPPSRLQVMFDDKLSTVWSAPNYCYRCGNLASILEVSETLQRTFNVFDRSEKSVIDDPTLPDVNKVRIGRHARDAVRILRGSPEACGRAGGLGVGPFAESARVLPVRAARALGWPGRALGWAGRSLVYIVSVLCDGALF